MTVCIEVDDPFRCPDKSALLAQILALLPEGRAWQNDPVVFGAAIGTSDAQYGNYELGSTQGLGSVAADEGDTTLHQYWCSYAELLEYLHQRACALIDEMFCATAHEMLDEWGRDYGFPDDCEPWESLCDKVAAIGGATCGYLSYIAARRGFSIECVPCGGVQSDCAQADCARLCECIPGQVTIRVFTTDSPAYSADWNPPLADVAVADCNAPCPPSNDSLECLIERFKPAHIRAHYDYV